MIPLLIICHHPTSLYEGYLLITLGDHACHSLSEGGKETLKPERGISYRREVEVFCNGDTISMSGIYIQNPRDTDTKKFPLIE